MKIAFFLAVFLPDAGQLCFTIGTLRILSG